MAANADDIKALLAKIEEAEAILARQHELEVEIQQAEKRLSRVQKFHADVEKDAETAQAKLVELNGRFEHERARYTADLAAHVELCEKTKTEAGVDSAATLCSLNADIEAFRTRCATEKRELVSVVGVLRGERDCLLAACREFKRQIAALPE